ncbi:MAG: hypothetical protein AAFV90_26975 [Cyanobacteria bacterium J06634_5]
MANAECLRLKKSFLRWGFLTRESLQHNPDTVEKVEEDKAEIYEP